MNIINRTVHYVHESQMYMMHTCVYYIGIIHLSNVVGVCISSLIGSVTSGGTPLHKPPATSPAHLIASGRGSKSGVTPASRVEAADRYMYMRRIQCAYDNLELLCIYLCCMLL